jgi:hypothetical protein
LLRARPAPSPLAGEGWGEGWLHTQRLQLPPSLSLPHKGGGNVVAQLVATQVMRSCLASAVTLHFAYGSNMSRALMGARCPGATALGSRRLRAGAL